RVRVQRVLYEIRLVDDDATRAAQREQVLMDRLPIQLVRVREDPRRLDEHDERQEDAVAASVAEEGLLGLLRLRGIVAEEEAHHDVGVKGDHEQLPSGSRPPSPRWKRPGRAWGGVAPGSPRAHRGPA